MIRFRRFVQTFCLVIFLSLLALASTSGISAAFLDIFLSMDPGLVLISALSAQIFQLSFIPAVLVLAVAPFAGRIFCGYICPMGTTIDFTDQIFAKKKPSYFFSKKLFRVKYLVLVFLIAAALFGVSFVFLASPLSLITRAYGLVVFPVITFLSKEVLDLIRPLGDILDISAISFAQVRTIRFSTQFFILIFFALVFGMIIFSPRFWCRYLCPSGALTAFFSRSPLIRRQVSEKCTQCGKCARSCPMSAIEKENQENTCHSECIVCRTCEEICPENAVSFGKAEIKELQNTFSPERRQVVSTGIIGAGTAVLSLTGLNSLYGKAGDGQVAAQGLVRPPGSIPETDFLARCTRCGECMVACPTNTLQPIFLKAGFTSMFSPAITPRRGFCDPQCHECANACPTKAVIQLEKTDRVWAKTGTARIYRQKCLAWEFDKSCMVCDEVCPYDAIEFLKKKDHKVPVPNVVENKCAGCGYCEHFCPVRNQAAIVVTPMDEIRLETGNHENHARLRGFDLQLKPVGDNIQEPQEDYLETHQGPAPGFDE